MVSIKYQSFNIPEIMATTLPPSFDAQSWMQEAIGQAKIAQEKGEVPIGAVIVYKGEILAQAHNQVENGANATYHAELIAINEACKLLNSKYLPECDLYVTLEPCAMCAGAIAHAKIRKVTYGAYDPKGGAVDHGPRFFQQATCHHQPEIIGGVNENECKLLLTNFFAGKR